MLEGRIRHPWTDRHNRRHLVTQRLVKAIRLNLALGWVQTQFPQIKILYTLRHPCAVVSSRLKLGNWDTHLDEMLAQDQLVEDYLSPYHDTIARASDPLDRHAIMWCIENLVPLQQLNAATTHVLFYEHFCNDLIPQVKAMCQFLGRPPPSNIQDTANKPSAHTPQSSAIHQGKNLLAPWREHLTAVQVDRVLHYVQQFGLGHLYTDDPLPHTDYHNTLTGPLTNTAAPCAPTH